MSSNRVKAILAALVLLCAGPASQAADKIRPEIVFVHKYEHKYDCTLKMETLKYLVPFMGADFKAELTEYYAALAVAIEDAQNGLQGQCATVQVSAKGIDSELTAKEDGLMDLKMNLPKAWLTLHNVTVKDIKKVFEKYLK